MAILITLASRAGAISLISAGLENPTIDVCGTTVPLEAIIVGDPAGHTFLWEQTSGPAVIIDDPTAISTFFTNVGGADKSFTFYIDKNTGQEQSATLFFSNTPQSPTRSISLPRGVGASPSGPTAFPVTEVFGAVDNQVALPGPTNGEAVVTPVFTVTWNHPGQANDAYITQYIVIENTIPVTSLPSTPLSATETGVAPSGPPSDTKEYALGAITSYEVSALYNFHGFTQVAVSAVFDFTGTPVDPTRAIDDSTDMSLPSGVGISITRFLNTVVQVPLDEMESVSLPGPQNVAITRYTTFAVEVPTDDAESMSLPTGSSLSVTRFDPSGIGGGGG
jgi:hypothetical protein